MNKKRLVLFILILFLTIPAFAQEAEHPIDKELGECIARDSTTAGMNNCTEKACKQWDVELNKYYKLLMGVLNKEGKQQLKDSQAAWLKYRDLETKFRMSSFLNMQGTMYTNMAMANKLYIIKQRAIELRELYDTLNYIRNE